MPTIQLRNVLLVLPIAFWLAAPVQACWCFVDLAEGCQSCQTTSCPLCNNGHCSGTSQICGIKNAVYQCDVGAQSYTQVEYPCYTTYNCVVSSGSSCTFSGCIPDWPSGGTPSMSKLVRFEGTGGPCTVTSP